MRGEGVVGGGEKQQGGRRESELPGRCVADEGDMQSDRDSPQTMLPCG